MPKSETDTSRISVTAYQTGYTWVRNGLSHEAFSTIRGRAMYAAISPMMWLARNFFHITDLETRLLQRHLIIDSLLKQAVEEKGLSQVLEIGCGFSPRGFRFMQEYGKAGLKYVEADLPAMAAEKKAVLSKAGLLGPGHEVIYCNILEKDGESSLENTILSHFDPSLPLAVITEGLTCYFDIDTIMGFWKRLSTILNKFPNSVYFTDNNQNLRGSGRTVRLGMGKRIVGLALMGLWKSVVGLTVRGGLHLHFNSEAEAGAAFNKAGFSVVKIHRTRDFEGMLPHPRTRGAERMNVIEARP